MSAPTVRRTVRRRRVAVVFLAAGTVAATAAITGLLPAASASSHREAPLIAADPAVDNTDVYAFTSPDRPDTVTLIANWQGLQGSPLRVFSTVSPGQVPSAGYGLGMAATLTAAGLLLVRLRDRLARLTLSPGWQSWGRRFGATMPVLTAVLVVAVGVGLAVRGLTGPI